MSETYHIPVLLEEAVEQLSIRPDGVYVDLTFGGGGHSRRILSELSSRGRLYSLDQDPDARVNAPDDERFTFVESNFRFVRGALRSRGVDRVTAYWPIWASRRTISTRRSADFRSVRMPRSTCV